MQLLKLASIKLTILLVAGILLCMYIPIGIEASSILTIVFLFGLGLYFYIKRDPNSIVFAALVVATTISLGMLIASSNNPKNNPRHYSHYDTKKPASWTLKIKEVLKPNTYNEKYIAETKLVNNDVRNGKILLQIPIDSLQIPLTIDTEIRVFTTPQKLKQPLNPYQFNYKKYMETLGVYHQISIQKGNYLIIPNSSSTLYGFASSIRNNLIRKLKKAPFGAEELSIIQALLLGQRQDIADTTYDQYKKAGAVHILAVSGLHIGILLLLLEFLLQPLEYLPNGKKIKLVALVFLLWSFALVAGFSASIIRATTMFTFVAYALYLNRPSNTFNILALSMGFILLVIDPNLIFQVGFQMSYAAVFAIAWIYPMLQRFCFPKNKILNKIWQLLSVSIAAQVGVLPISLFYFHQFPSLFFVSNIVIIPFLGLILGFGILVIFLTSINYLPDTIVYIYNFIIDAMNTVVAWVANQEAFLFIDISFNRLQLFLSYGILILLVNALTKTTFRKVSYFLASILLWQVLLIYQNDTLQKEQQLWVAHQTKNSVLLYQNGNKLLVKSSKKEIYTSIINNYKIEKNIVSVDSSSLSNAYTFGSMRFHIIDSSGIYIPTQKPAIYLLSNSPKLNLDRFIDSVCPTKIIADGSNYKTYVARWKATCLKRKLPFHYTGEKGAFNIFIKK